MDVGQALVGPVTGATGRAFTALQNMPNSGLLPVAFVEGTESRRIIASLIQAIAQGIIEELAENGTITIRTTDAGLQRDADGLNPPTLAPTSDVELTGRIS